VTGPIEVDTTKLRTIGRDLSDETRAALLPVWDALARAGIPADPHAAQAEAADVAAGLTSCLAGVAEEIRRGMVELQEIGDSLIRAAQAYEETDREAHRLNRDAAAPPRHTVPHTDPARWKL
jgi:hypothetical protein